MSTKKLLVEKINNTLEKLKIFSYSEFDGVYSKQYYTNVVSKMFSSKDINYSYIFGDFNKLNKINKLYRK